MIKLYLTFLCAFSFFAGNANPEKSPFPDAFDQVKVLTVYPNPATSFVNFEFEANQNYKNYTLYIFSFIGKKMNEYAVDGNKITVPLDEYYRGMYVYQLRNQNGMIVQSGRFQVVK
jgi:hypothetical protein